MFLIDSVQGGEEEARIVDILIDGDVVGERDAIDSHGKMDGDAGSPCIAEILTADRRNLKGEIEGLRCHDNPTFLVGNILDSGGVEEIECFVAQAVQHKQDGGFFCGSGRHILHILPFLTAPS